MKRWHTACQTHRIPPPAKRPPCPALARGGLPSAKLARESSQVGMCTAGVGGGVAVGRLGGGPGTTPAASTGRRRLPGWMWRLNCASAWNCFVVVKRSAPPGRNGARSSPQLSPGGGLPSNNPPLNSVIAQLHPFPSEAPLLRAFSICGTIVPRHWTAYEKSGQTD